MTDADQQLRKEYGDDTLDGLVPPSASGSSRGNGSLEVEDDPYNFAALSPSTPPKSLLFYVATLQAFVIIYRTEVLLGAALAACVGVALSSSHHTRHRKKSAFALARIEHDYAAVTSKYDLSLGAIDHWCLRGDDNSCRCEDPLEPMSKRSSRKWQQQHEENVKVAQAAVQKALAGAGAGDDLYRYDRDFDDGWVDGSEDDWVYGEGARFGQDDTGFNPYDDDFGYDNFADPEEMEKADTVDNLEQIDFGIGEDYVDFGNGEDYDWDAEDDTYRRNLEQNEEPYVLDVVFVGDSLTEQRQGTSMGQPVTKYEGIKEVFDKTFTKAKGGEFNGIAMGIAGDTSKNLLWRLMHGEIPWALTPKVWWVGIGINDLSMKGCSEEVVLLGILRVVEEIQSTQPEAIVVINSLLPVQRNADGLLERLGKKHEDVALKKKEKDLEDAQMSEKRDHHDLWPSVVAINAGLRRFAASHKGVKFFDANGVFVEERQGGKYLKVDLMRDPVHPNLSGHKKWNNAVKKRLHELIKD